MHNSWTKFKDRSTPATVPLDNVFYEYVQPGSKVLDFGCGWGRISFELHSRGYNLCGLDINPNELHWATEEKAKQAYDQPLLQFTVADAINLPFAAESFDAAVMVAFMVTLAERSQRSQVIEQAARVLKPHGILYLSLFTQNWDVYRARYEAHFPMTGELCTFIVHDTHDIEGNELYRCHHYTEWEITDLLNPKFNVEHLAPAQFITPSGSVNNGMYIFAEKI
ncbi:class I SAM-dependent methyltransferase [Candidatus Woesearchaeota archaeon]|nr:class I SAM-dependent methyltransferase [Candidatus Woesearchaeota archaeon]